MSLPCIQKKKEEEEEEEEEEEGVRPTTIKNRVQQFQKNRRTHLTHIITYNTQIPQILSFTYTSPRLPQVYKQSTQDT